MSCHTLHFLRKGLVDDVRRRASTELAPCFASKDKAQSDNLIPQTDLTLGVKMDLS